MHREVEDVDRADQCACGQHPQFLDDMGLGYKRCEPEGGADERDGDPVEAVNERQRARFPKGLI